MKKFNKSLLILIVSVILSITAVPVKVSATSAFTIYYKEGGQQKSYDESNLPEGITYDANNSTLTFDSTDDPKTAITIEKMEINQDMNIVVNTDLNFTEGQNIAILADGDYKIYLKIAEGKKIYVTNSDGSSAECVLYKGLNPLYSLRFKERYGIDGKYQAEPGNVYNSKKETYSVKNAPGSELTYEESYGDADLTLIPDTLSGSLTKVLRGGATGDVCSVINGFVKNGDPITSVTYDTDTYTVKADKGESYLYLELLFPESELEKGISYTFLKPGNKEETITFPDHYSSDSNIPTTVIGNVYDAGSGKYYVSYYMLLESDDVTDDVYTYHDVSLKLTNGDTVRYINVVSEADHQPVTPAEPEGGGDTEPEGGGNTEPEGGNTNPEGNNNQGSTPESGNSGGSNDETPSVVYKAPDTSVR